MAFAPNNDSMGLCCDPYNQLGPGGDSVPGPGDKGGDDTAGDLPEEGTDEGEGLQPETPKRVLWTGTDGGPGCDKIINKTSSTKMFAGLSLPIVAPSYRKLMQKNDWFNSAADIRKWLKNKVEPVNKASQIAVYEPVKAGKGHKYEFNPVEKVNDSNGATWYVYHTLKPAITIPFFGIPLGGNRHSILYTQRTKDCACPAAATGGTSPSCCKGAAGVLCIGASYKFELKRFSRTICDGEPDWDANGHNMPWEQDGDTVNRTFTFKCPDEKAKAEDRDLIINVSYGTPAPWTI